jgi:hypothetical protein
LLFVIVCYSCFIIVILFVIVVVSVAIAAGAADAGAGAGAAIVIVLLFILVHTNLNVSFADVSSIVALPVTQEEDSWLYEHLRYCSSLSFIYST